MTSIVLSKLANFITFFKLDTEKLLIFLKISSRSTFKRLNSSFSKPNKLKRLS